MIAGFTWKTLNTFESKGNQKGGIFCVSLSCATIWRKRSCICTFLLVKQGGVKMVFLQEHTVPKFDVASKRWGESAYIPFVLVWKNIPCSPANHSLGYSTVAINRFTHTHTFITSGVYISTHRSYCACSLSYLTVVFGSQMIPELQK